MKLIVLILVFLGKINMQKVKYMEIQHLEVIKKEVDIFYEKVFSHLRSVDDFFDERNDKINEQWKISIKKLEQEIICSVGSPRLWIELLINGRYFEFSQNIQKMIKKQFIKKDEYQQFSYNRLSFWLHKVAVSCMLVRYPNNNFDKIKFVNVCQIDRENQYEPPVLKKYACITDNNENDINNNSEMVFLYDFEIDKTYDTPSIFWACIGGEVQNNWSKLAMHDDNFSKIYNYEQGQDIPPPPSIRMSIDYINNKMQDIDGQIQRFSQNLLQVIDDYCNYYRTQNFYVFQFLLLCYFLYGHKNLICKKYFSMQFVIIYWSKNSFRQKSQKFTTQKFLVSQYRKINKIIQNMNKNYDVLTEKTKQILEGWKKYPSSVDTEIFDLGKQVSNYKKTPFDFSFSPYKSGLEMIRNKQYRKAEVFKDFVIQVLFGIIVDFIIIIICTQIIAFVYSKIIVENCPGFSMDVFFDRLLRAVTFITNIDTTLEIENDY